MEPIEATLDGQDSFASEMIPRVKVNIPKPRFINNGYNSYSGLSPLHVLGLFAALPPLKFPVSNEVSETRRAGYVNIYFNDGSHFNSYTEGNPEEIYHFS